MEKWDFRFLRLAEQISWWSKDPSTQVGSVLVSPDRRIVLPSYNGFAAGDPDSINEYKDREIKYKKIIHAEENGILSSRSVGIDLSGYSIFTWPFQPCFECSNKIILSGIKRVVSVKPFGNRKDRWKESFQKARDNFNKYGIEVKLYSRGSLG